MSEEPEAPYWAAMGILELDRIAKNHPNYHLVKESDLQYARDLVARAGWIFPPPGYTDIKELVDGARSERNVRVLLDFLRFLENSGFPNDSTDFPEQPWARAGGHDRPKPKPRPATSSPVLDMLYGFIAAAVMSYCVYWLTRNTGMGFGWEGILERVAMDQANPITVPVANITPSSDAFPGLGVPSSTQQSIADIFESNGPPDPPSIEVVVDTIKKSTLYSAENVQDFDRKYPYFMADVSETEVAECIRDKRDAKELGPQEFKECAIDLKPTIQGGIPLTKKLLDFVEFEFDYEQAVACLVWRTCSKTAEWKKRPIPADY